MTGFHSALSPTVSCLQHFSVKSISSSARMRRFSPSDFSTLLPFKHQSEHGCNAQCSLIVTGTVPLRPRTALPLPTLSRFQVTLDMASSTFIGSLLVLMQAALVDHAAVDRIVQTGDTTIQRLAAIFREYSDRTCFGIPSKGGPEWRLVTYQDVWQRIQVSHRQAPPL